MRTAICHLKSVSPYSQSKYIPGKCPRDMTHEEYEEQTWRQRLHRDENGMVFIPPMAFKNVMSEAAKFKPMQIPGKGKTTYTKHFEAGVMCYVPVPLGIKVDDVPADWVHVPSDGRRGGTKRVLKCFGVVPKWEASVEILVLDDIIPEEVFEQVLRDAGALIGIGRFRPRNNGYYGRFEVVSVKWK